MVLLVQKASMALVGAAFLSVGAFITDATTSVASAATVTDGLTFSVASSNEDTDNGAFIYDSFSYLGGTAEVGLSGGQGRLVRGLSEYNLAGLIAGSAFASFDVYRLGGDTDDTNGFPFTGTLDIVSYSGNNAENISDYQASSLGTISVLETENLMVGDTLSFDISSIYNNALLSNLSSLGIRLQVTNPNDVPLKGEGLGFNNFRLTSDGQATAVPTPALLPGLIGLGLGAWRKRKATIAEQKLEA
jgi:hypothetical protein